MPKLVVIRKKIKLRTWIALGLLAVLSPIILFNLYRPQSGEAAWFNDAWAYRKPITIPSHTASEDNVYVTVPEFDATDTTRFQADCGDLRFTKENGQLLQYYVVDCDATATVHVQFDTLPAGASTYYMYYGNPSAVNGTKIADFSTAASNVGVQTLGSEAKSNGPAVYWKFDEGQGQVINDQTSNNNDATLGLTTSIQSDDPQWLTEDMCISGKCLKFDGNTTTVNLTNGGNIKYTDGFTISMWFYSNSFSNPDAPELFRARLSGTNKWISLRVGYNNELEFMIVTETSNLEINSPNNYISENKWYHAVAVYNPSGTTALFIDGQQMTDTSTSSVGTITLNGDTTTGRGFNSWEWNGRIDEVKVYSYARSAAQIKADFVSRGGSEGAAVALGASSQKFLSDGLIAYWKMDDSGIDAEDETITDSSGNSVSGTLKGDNSTGDNGSGMDCTTSGNFHTACDFDGTDDYVIGTLDGTSYSEYTYGFWFKTDTVAGADGIFQWADQLSDGSPAFYVDRNGTDLRVYNSGAYSTGITIAADTWYRFDATYKDSVTNIYLNGEHRVTFNRELSSTTYKPSAISIYAGNGFQGYFDGKIDEIRIYKRALSASEISQLAKWGPGPVGYWNMDEGNGQSTAELGGNGYTGQLGSTSGSDSNDPTWTNGKFGNAIAFDSSANQYVVTTATGIFPYTQNLSVSAWVKPTAQQHAIIVGNVGGTAGFGLGVRDTGAVWLVTKSVKDYITTTTSLVPTNTWTHIAAVLDIDYDVSFYVNGKFVEKVTHTVAGIANSTEAFMIGNWNGNYKFSGTIDEVRIYNYARTPAQIVEDMNGGHPIGGSPVGSQRLWWKFDDMSGTTAQDSGPNNYDGTLGGATLPAWKTDGKIGKALDFTAVSGATTGSRVTYSSPTNASLGTTTGDQLTLTLWLKPDSSQTNPSTAYFIRNGTGLDMNYGAFLSSVSGGYFLLSIQYHDGTNFRTLATTARHVQADAWNHIALVFTQGTDVKVYVNGTLRQTLAWTGSSSVASTTTFNIGGHPGANSQSIDGYIDEVKVYSGALTDEQIKLDMNAGGGINFGATANTEASLLSDGAGTSPVAYWNMDEKTDNTCTSGVNDVCDKSGNTSDLALTSTSWTRGKYGSALDFNSSSVASVSDNANISLTTVGTVEAWVNSNSLYPSADGTTRYRNIVNKWAGGACSGADEGYFLYWVGTSSSGTLQGSNCNGTTQDTVSTAYTFTPNSWYHITYTWDASYQTLYVNGKVVKQEAVTLTLQDDSSTLWIGCGFSCGNPDYRWDGKIDEVKIYNYARTPAQIGYSYNRGAPIAHWKFDECQGSTVNDASGNGHTGTINVGDATGDNDSVGNCSGAASTEMWGEGSTGKFNSSLGFDGTNDYISVPTGNTISFGGDFTISSWFKTSEGSERPIVSNRTATGAMYYGIAANKGFIYQTSATPPNLSTTRTISDNNWHHFVYVRTGTTTNLYLDGKLDATTTQTGYSTALQAIRIGHDVANSTEYFSGLIDDVRIYNYALSADQVEVLHNGGGGTRFGPSSGAP